MEVTAQGTAMGLPPCRVSDLREFSFGELAQLADSGDSVICGAVKSMVDDEDGRALVEVTAFNSSI